MGIMARDGFNVSATAIYTTIQGELAALAGAKYLILYYNRMMNLDIDADKVFREVADAILVGGYDCRIVGASFKSVMQLTNAIADGAHALTVPPDLLESALEHPSIAKAVSDFQRDWAGIYGNRTLADL